MIVNLTLKKENLQLKKKKKPPKVKEKEKYQIGEIFAIYITDERFIPLVHRDLLK